MIDHAHRGHGRLVEVVYEAAGAGRDRRAEAVERPDDFLQGLAYQGRENAVRAGGELPVLLVGDHLEGQEAVLAARTDGGQSPAQRGQDRKLRRGLDALLGEETTPRGLLVSAPLNGK